MTNHPARVRAPQDQAARVAAAGALTVVLEHAREADALQRHLLERAVLRARLEGQSWTTIGRTLGVSRQAARRRWRYVEDIPGDVHIKVDDHGRAYAWSEALQDELHVDDQVLALGLRRMEQLVAGAQAVTR